MRKIAIITTREFYESTYYDDYDMRKVIDTITDWEEVDDKTYEILQNSAYENNFKILEQPVDQGAFIAKTVKDYLHKIELRKIQEAKRKEEEEAKKALAAEKRKAKQLAKLIKDQESERALLAQLIAKHPDMAKGE